MLKKIRNLAYRQGGPKSETLPTGRQVQNPRNAGFTIAEMLVVTIIIGILSTIGTRTYFNERDRFEFNNALTSTIGMINLARNMATSSQSVYSPTAGKQIVPREGYGVYINLQPINDEPNFTLFASLGDEDADPTTPNKKFNSGNDYVMERYRLPKQVEFQYFLYEGIEKWDNNLEPPAATKTEAVIFFRPPLADTYIGSNEVIPQDLEKLGMRFYNINAIEGSKKACQKISITRVKAFPTIEASDCSEFDFKKE